jgi:hypothetical protein
VTAVQYGARYDENLRTVEIAKLVRQDIKLATRGGLLPAGLGLSVRSERFAGGSSIDIEVTRMPEGVRVLSAERLALDASGQGANGTPWASPDARRIETVLGGLLAAYNRDGSDPMTDHYDVKFYGRVQFATALTIAEGGAVLTRRERLEAKVERRRGWAETRHARAAAGFAQGAPYRGDIAFNTQPGHIPERARIIRAEDRACENLQVARHHEAKADGLERALEHTIFDDDPDAIERLTTRADANETKANLFAAINKAWRKGADHDGSMPLAQGAGRHDEPASARPGGPGAHRADPPAVG